MYNFIQKKEQELKMENPNYDNISLFVDNDYIQIQNKTDLLKLRQMEEDFSDEIYSKEDNEIKTKFYELDEKIGAETIQIDYQRTSDLLEKLLTHFNINVEITPA